MYLCQCPASPACQLALIVNMGVEWGNRNEKESPGNEEDLLFHVLFWGSLRIEKREILH